MPVSQNQPEKSEVQKAEEKQAAKVEKLDQNNDVLAAAAASGDAAVHNLLGHRAVAVQNQDEDAIKDIDKQLSELLK